MRTRFRATFTTRASVETTTIVPQRFTQASVVSPKLERNMNAAAGSRMRERRRSARSRTEEERDEAVGLQQRRTRAIGSPASSRYLRAAAVELGHAVRAR